MAEEFQDGPAFIERSLSAPSLSVYDTFQDLLPSNLPSRLNPRLPQSSHFNVNVNVARAEGIRAEDSSLLAAFNELDILDDSHVAQIKSLVIDPKAKTPFDLIQADFPSTPSALFSNEGKTSPQQDETDELADVLTGIDQTALSLQDLYVNDDDPNPTGRLQHQSSNSNEVTTYSNQLQLQQTQRNLNLMSQQFHSQQSSQTNTATPSNFTYSAPNNASVKSSNPLYSPTSSIYPSLSSPTEGDIRGTAPPFTLGTPGGGYQGIQSHYNHGAMTQSAIQSQEGMYSNSTDMYGNNIQTVSSNSLPNNPYIQLDMSGGVAMGLGGAGGVQVDPVTQQQLQANGYYIAATATTPQQGMYPEYYQMGMTSQGYLVPAQQDDSGMYTPATSSTTSEGMNYMAYPAQQAQQQMYWSPYTQQALQQQYQHQQLLMMQSMYQQTGDYSSLQSAMNGQQLMYGGMSHQINGMQQLAMPSSVMTQSGGYPAMSTQIQQQSGYNSATAAANTMSTNSVYTIHGNQVQLANATSQMVPVMNQQTAQMNYPSADRTTNLPAGTSFVMPNGMVVPASATYGQGYPIDSFATHAMMGHAVLPNGYAAISREAGDQMGMTSNGHSLMGSHPTLARNNPNDRRNQISRVNATGRLPNSNQVSNNNLMSMNASRDLVVEDFRSTYGKGRQWEIKDLIGHVVAFCQDQHGSRFIQQRLEVATAQDKQIVFDEVITNAQALITDVFGNYVIQKLFEFGSPEQCETLASLLTGQAVNLALQMYGCRVIQKALEYVQTPRLLYLVGEFEGQQVLKCVHDQNGNHVIQKCIEVMSRVAKISSPDTTEYLNSRIQYIIQSFQGRVKELSMHPYGCRVVQRILEHCTNDQKGPVLEELRVCCRDLIQDQYGNYVIQHMIQHGWETDQAVLMKEVHSKLLEYSQHKFASNVVEKCIQYADKQNRDEMIWTIINVTFDLNNPVDAKTGQCVLENMVRDPYANYVVQKVIDVSNETQRGAISRYVRENIVQLRRYTYGKHIIVRLERVSGEKF